MKLKQSNTEVLAGLHRWSAISDMASAEPHLYFLSSVQTEDPRQSLGIEEPEHHFASLQHSHYIIFFFLTVCHIMPVFLYHQARKPR